MMELSLDSSQIVKNICMVKFEIINYQSITVVMDKFRALIKEGAVVFISLHNKVIAVTQTRRQPGILRHTANQKSRLQPGTIENFDQHTAGGSFAMGARYREHMFVPQNRFSQPLGAGDIGESLVEHSFNAGISSGQRITDYN